MFWTPQEARDLTAIASIAIAAVFVLGMVVGLLLVWLP